MIKHFKEDEEMKMLLYEGASMCELMETIRFEWCKHYYERYSEADNISQCIMQMIELKIQSILKLCEGVPLPSYQPAPVFLDSASIIALLRCIYEEVFIFHNLFATERNDAEKAIVLNLWKIKGINNQIFEEDDKSIDFKGKEDMLEQYASKIEKKKEQVESLKSEIEYLLEQLEITDKTINEIRFQLNHQKRSIKGYEFVKDGNNIVDFILIDLAASPEKIFGTKKLNPLYRLLSAHSHPTYMGVFKFGVMYNTGGDIQLLKMALRGICVMSAIFINDFLSSVINGHKIKEQLPGSIKRKLDFYPQVE